VDELYWYAGECSTDWRVQGIFPFTYDIGGREWEKFDIRDQVWVEKFFSKLDAVGMPKAGALPTAPPATPPPGPSVTVVQQFATRPGTRWGFPTTRTLPSRGMPASASLGNPVTTEFDISGYRAQGFTGGIVYARSETGRISRS